MLPSMPGSISVTNSSPRDSFVLRIISKGRGLFMRLCELALVRRRLTYDQRDVQGSTESIRMQRHSDLHSGATTATHFAEKSDLTHLEHLRSNISSLGREQRSISQFGVLRLLQLAVISVCFLLTTVNAYGKTTPTLSVATSGTPSTYGGSVTFTATISTGPTGTITFLDGGTSIGTGTISGTKATFTTTALSAGSHSITANYPGNSTYNSVTSSAITQTVNKATLTLSVATSGTPSTYGGSVTFTATISSGQLGTVTFYDGGTSIGTGTINGTTAVRATSALTVGAHTITASWPGNTNYNSVTSSAITQTVSKATPTITWATPSPITYGTALSATQLNATTTPAGTFVYTPTSGTVLGAGARTLSVTFTPTDTSDYNSATTTVTLTVNKATPTITWATPAPIVYGTALSATQLNASTAPAGSFAYTPASGTVLGAGSQILSDKIATTETTDYNTATATVTLTVNKATPTITWATPASITYGTVLSATQLNASTAPAGSFVYTPTFGTVLGVGQQTLSVTFTPTDTTDYNTATATVTLTVSALPNSGPITLPGQGIISTLVGNGTAGYSGNAGLALGMALDAPWGIAVDAAGNIYIADKASCVIRKVTAATGIITTIAGNGTAGNSGDGGLAINAELNNPMGLAVDSVGNLYIADNANNAIRMVTASSGTISTVAGNPTNQWGGYSGDNGPATQADLNYPVSVSLDLTGNIFIADTFNGVIRKIAAG